MKRSALEILHRYYGFSDFRPGQWDAISGVLESRDGLILMPTGGGKSLCYQIPALMSDGCAIVISPLIALMNDQVAALQANGIPTDRINSNRPEYDNRAVYDRAKRGELKLLYVSPERLMTDLERIKAEIKVSFIAVDEAHCISQWGHDFRPVYTALKCLKENWATTPIIALTATADRPTRDDIIKSLNLKDPVIYIGSFDRPNLSIKVITGSKQTERVDAISGLISRYPMDCGIVYCLSRKKTETMARHLSERGHRVGIYHAGMTAGERESVQRDFINGRLQAICATVAFGMGIDKSNIRWVVHNNLPGNIESYYQEIGRAGRDGLPAETILFYSYGDVLTRMTFAEESGRKDVNIEKLNFIQRYAEASVCRRRILLSYFSEETDRDCGNCDNCRNPRAKFDATVMARKALSAIVRVNNSEGINVIIEILRGLSRNYIIEKGYDRLPTYGVGKDMGSYEWQNYILQMIQLGLIEIAYDDNFHLRPTPAGRRVLRGEKQVMLAAIADPRDVFSFRAGNSGQPAVAPLSAEDRLSQDLKILRSKLSEAENIADYMIFSDVTIEDIVKRKPTTLASLTDIEGLGLVKISRYYKELLKTIRKSLGVKESLPKGLSHKVTHLLYQQGIDVPEIASIRQLVESTICTHIVRIIDEGKKIDLWRTIPKEVFFKVSEALRPIDQTEALSEVRREVRDAIYSRLNKEYGLENWKIGLVYGLRNSIEKLNLF